MSAPALLMNDEAGGLRIRVSGDWRAHGLPSAADVAGQVAGRTAPRITWDGTALEDWDSRLPALVLAVDRAALAHGGAVDRSGLPTGARRLLDLAEAVTEKTDARHSGDPPDRVERIGQDVLERGRIFSRALTLVGDVVLAGGAALAGRSRFRSDDVALLVRQAGWDALPVVALVNVLVGMILGFVGASQLDRYGTTLYVADLVAIAMVRDMSGIMTGIVMAGRSGAAYAAEIGTMKASQEIDALVTLGIDPSDFLVAPRLLALTAMMPLLTLYANFLSILGGGFVVSTMVGFSFTTYLHRAAAAVSPGLLAGGLAKAAVYGALVAFAGCLQGLEADRSAAGVGIATTRSVVWSIVLIITAAGTFAVIFHVLRW